MRRPLSPISHRAHAGIRFTETPSEGGEQNPQGGAGGGTPPPANPPAGTFTQEDLNRVGAREKAEGKAAAERDLAAALGVSLEDAKAIIKKAKDADDAAKTESQRDRDAAAKEKADAEADRAAAKKEVHVARLERAFGSLGIDLSDEKAKDKNLRLLRMVTTETGATYDDILADVKAIQKDFPALFTVDPGDGDGKGGDGKGGGQRRTPSSDPGGRPPRPTPGEGNFEAGRERARARYALDEGLKENPLVAAGRRS